jgi:hypothetical protein
MRVPGTKTAAAERVATVLPLLRDELATYAAGCRDRGLDALVFGTSRGHKQSPTNIRRRVLAPAVELANAALAERDGGELPADLTPHGLRRTCASILVALGWDPARVMRMLGHTSPQMTLGVYAAAMDWSDGEAERLRALVEGHELPGVEAERVGDDVADAEGTVASASGRPAREPLSGHQRASARPEQRRRSPLDCPHQRRSPYVCRASTGVGDGGLEPPTSSLSEKRSNRLS